MTIDIKSLSIKELTQLLSRVNQDISSIKRAERRANKAALSNSISELAECNIIAQRFSGKHYPAPIQNRRIIEDIAIQKDILDYLNNGGHIITHVARGNKKRPVKPLTVAYTNKVAL